MAKRPNNNKFELGAKAFAVLEKRSARTHAHAFWAQFAAAWGMKNLFVYHIKSRSGWRLALGHVRVLAARGLRIHLGVDRGEN